MFVFTGFRDEVLAARMQNAGGIVAGPDAGPTGKVRKAREYGISVRSRESFEREFYIAQ